MEEQGRGINVLLVEDDRLVFEGLSLLLADEADMKVVGVATTAGEAVEKAQLLVPDVVLIDYHLPDGDGAQATERIHSVLPDVVTLFLSADTSEEVVQRAIEAGASGYVSKAAPAEDLIEGIRRAADGEYLLEAATIARLAEQSRRSQLRPGQLPRTVPRLTALEQDVAPADGERPGQSLDRRLAAARPACRAGTRPAHPREAGDPLESAGPHDRARGRADRALEEHVAQAQRARSWHEPMHELREQGMVRAAT